MNQAVIHICKYLSNLGRRCQQNCLFCMERMELTDIPEILPTRAKICAAIERYRNQTGMIDRLYIAGGEPTMRDDLPLILSDAKRYASQVILSSNCNYDEKTIRILLESNIFEIATSFHGDTEQLHDFLTQTPGSFSALLNAINVFQSHGIAIDINCVICSYNVNRMDKILQKLAMLGPFRRIVFTHFIFHGHAFFHPELLFNVDSCGKMISRTLDIAEELNLPVAFRDFPFCLDPRLEMNQEDTNQMQIVPIGKNQPMSERAPFIEKPSCLVCKKASTCPKYLKSNYDEG